MKLIANGIPGDHAHDQRRADGHLDFDVSSPLVQRMLSTKSSELERAFVEHLKQAQDQAFQKLRLGVCSRRRVT